MMLNQKLVRMWGQVVKVLAVLILFTLPSIAQNADTLLIIRFDNKNFNDVVKGMKEEFESDIYLNEIIVNKETKVETIKDKILHVRPKLIILMDNKSVNMYKSCLSMLESSYKSIPTVSLMGILIDDGIKGLNNAAGIAYEIPLVTSAVNLRSILNKPIKRVGVVHRELYSSFITMNTKFCKSENISVVPILIPNTTKDVNKDLKKGLTKLLKEEKVDALWILNDNVLLTGQTLLEIWKPLLKKYKVPTIVGVDNLVDKPISLGTFAVLPDHESLGSQAASMIFDIKDNDWDASDKGVEQPLSVYKVINQEQAQKWFNVADDRLKTVDKISK